eukprot:m.142241 g.142241  ORF g.142241 m.142241 type:complete len:214 (+) comp15990_c0_seq2:79-720(+)
MPRKGVISTDQSSNTGATADASVFVYYCLCGHLALITEQPLEMMPKRNTDGAAFFNAKAIKHSMTLVKDDTVLIRRAGGVEPQHGLKCTACGLPIAYQTTPDSQTFFLRKGALLQPGETSDLAKNLGSIEELEQLEKTRQAKVQTGSSEPKSASVASSLLAAQFALEEEEASQAYEADAREIHRIMGKQATAKRPATDERGHPLTKKGTLLTP